MRAQFEELHWFIFLKNYWEPLSFSLPLNEEDFMIYYAEVMLLYMKRLRKQV